MATVVGIVVVVLASVAVCALALYVCFATGRRVQRAELRRGESPDAARAAGAAVGFFLFVTPLWMAAAMYLFIKYQRVRAPRSAVEAQTLTDTPDERDKPN